MKQFTLKKYIKKRIEAILGTEYTIKNNGIHMRKTFIYQVVEEVLDENKTTLYLEIVLSERVARFVNISDMGGKIDDKSMIDLFLPTVFHNLYIREDIGITG